MKGGLSMGKVTIILESEGRTTDALEEMAKHMTYFYTDDDDLDIFIVPDDK